VEAIFVAAIAAVSASIVAPVVNFFLQKASNKGALAQGMRALLWREICTIHRECVANKGITLEEREHLESVYQAYHAINGNGTGTRLYQEATNLPTIR